MLYILLFFGIPLLELVLLIEVGSVAGAWETVGLCMLTAVVGGWLAKHQGIGVLMRMRASVNRGELPASEVIDSVMIVVAGLMLMTPGFITDSLGLLLLTPTVRALIRPAILRRVTRMSSGQFGAHSPGPFQHEARYQWGPGQRPRDGAGASPEFLPPGSVQGPPPKNEPPEIIVD